MNLSCTKRISICSNPLDRNTFLVLEDDQLVVKSVDQLLGYYICWDIKDDPRLYNNPLKILDDLNKETPEIIYLSLLFRKDDLLDIKNDHSIKNSNELENYIEYNKIISAQFKSYIECYGKQNPWDSVKTHIFNVYFREYLKVKQLLFNPTLVTDDYSYLLTARLLAFNISNRTINFNYTKRVINFSLGTSTGRFKEKGNKLVHHLPKEQRHLITPNNDLFLELDIIAAEISMLYLLLNKPLPDYDLYDHINKTVFNNEFSNRSDIKTKVYRTIYSGHEEEFKGLNLDELKDQYFFEGLITTPHGRKISVLNPSRWISYLLQSVMAYEVHKNAFEIDRFLKGKKSYVSFTVHDSVIIDLSNEDIGLIEDIYKIFRETKFGRLKARVKWGKTWLLKE